MTLQALYQKIRNMPYHSPTKLALHFGVSTRTMNNILHQRKPPNQKILKKLGLIKIHTIYPSPQHIEYFIDRQLPGYWINKRCNHEYTKRTPKIVQHSKHNLYGKKG